jgi:branched-subunit amino acid transport protein
MRAEIVIICVFMTAVTYFCRAFLTLSVSRIRLTAWWENYLTFIPFAVLTALVTPYLLMPVPSSGFSLATPWSAAGAVTFIISNRTRNLLLSVGTGIAVFWVLGGIK